MRRIPDVDCHKGRFYNPCKLTFDDIYIFFAQRFKTEDYPEDYLRTMWEEVADAIMTYINRPYVPCKLRGVVVNMMFDILRYYKQMELSLEDPTGAGNIGINSVKSIQIGDTSIGANTDTSSDTISTSGRALNSHIPDLDSFLLNYELQLNPYRSLIPWRH